METEQLKVGEWIRMIDQNDGYDIHIDIGSIGQVIRTEYDDSEYNVFVRFSDIDCEWFWDWQFEKITEEEALLWKLSN